ncbi:MAG: RHS repeat-associated core domain-containing protein, partial [Chloroflexia bacterium]
YTYGTTPTTYRYTGQRWEAGIGLYFYNARYYDPALGRFIQPDTVVPDPADPQSLNRYTYALNSPLVYNDPSGRFPLIPAIIAIGAVGLALAYDYFSDGSFDTPGYVQTTVMGIAGMFTPEVNPLAGFRAQDFPTNPEMTDWLLQTMQANAAGIGQTLAGYAQGTPGEQAAAAVVFGNLVGPGGPWDFKKDLLDRNRATVSLAGKEWDYQIIANIHYGYVGRAAGFSGDLLLLGAGIAQCGSSGIQCLGWINTGFDEPADRAAILVGIYLWEKYGQYGIALTEEMLREALEKYEKDLVWEE